MSEPYTLARKGEGLLFVRHPRYGKQLWTLSIRPVTRKYWDRLCTMCGQRLGYHRAYRPITNLGNRMHRICKACGEKAT